MFLEEDRAAKLENNNNNIVKSKHNINIVKSENNNINIVNNSITVEQVSVKKSQVFFAIRNHKNSGKWCAGVRNVALLGKIFLMEQCNGQESQLFYSDAVDYSNEMAEYKKNTLIM